MLASIEKMVNPISVARNSSMRCFNWKNSRDPWVASPSDTIRALPTTFFSGSMSWKPCPASGVFRRIALPRTHSVTGSLGWAAIHVTERTLAAMTRPNRLARAMQSLLPDLQDFDITNAPCNILYCRFMSHYLAIDLGAESGRALLGSLSGGKLSVEELHRFPNTPVRVPGALYWDTLRLWHEIQHGIDIAARERQLTLDGIGIDTWGVDFGLLGPDGLLIDTPRHYRDARTSGVMEKLFEGVPRDQVFGYTGIQFMQLNTLYQLYAMRLAGSPALAAAARLLNIPDLFNYNKFTLKPGAREKLAKVAGILLAYPGLKVQLEGHTDSVGTEEYNMKLSNDRAGAVRDYLVSQSVLTANLTATGFGKASPVASNDTAAGRQQNRRVEMVVSGDPIGR